MNHDDLVQTAGRWLRNHERCPVVFCEPPYHTDEMPDVIGFKSGLSTVIECKTSRADALSELRKKWRAFSEGMGNRRFFMMPRDLALSLQQWVALCFPGHGLLSVVALARRADVTLIKPPALPRSLCDSAAREERHILEKSFHRLLGGRQFINKTGRFEPEEDFARRQAG